MHFLSAFVIDVFYCPQTLDNTNKLIQILLMFFIEILPVQFILYWTKSQLASS